MTRSIRATAIAISFVSAALVLAPVGVDAQTSLPVTRDLSALVNTYWYVPSANLTAYTYTPHGSPALSTVSDQTIWHITGAGNGYLTGCSFTSTDGKGAHWSASTLVGSVTASDTVSIGFFTREGVVVGQGTMSAVNGRQAFLMQMSAMPDATGLTHWAYMLPVTSTDADWSSLPGTSNVGVTTATAAGC